MGAKPFHEKYFRLVTIEETIVAFASLTRTFLSPLSLWTIVELVNVKVESRKISSRSVEEFVDRFSPSSGLWNEEIADADDVKCSRPPTDDHSLDAIDISYPVVSCSLSTSLSDVL